METGGAIIRELATTLNRRDEIPNGELAKRIAQRQDEEGVKELFELLGHPKEGIRNDAIKVLYEVATIHPDLIVPFSNTLITLLRHKSNRLQWGAMTALDRLALKYPERMFCGLAEVIKAADKGSVITNDHCVSILIKLCGLKKYADHAFPLLIERLKRSPVNQLPMYAEQAVSIIDAKNANEFMSTLIARLGEIQQESKKSRVEKIIKKATKQLSL